MRTTNKSEIHLEEMSFIIDDPQNIFMSRFFLLNEKLSVF